MFSPSLPAAMPERLLDHPWAPSVLAGLALLALAVLLALIARYLVVRMVHLASRRTAWTWDDAFARNGVFRRLAWVVPLLVMKYGLPLIPGLPAGVLRFGDNLLVALLVLVLVLAGSALLGALEALYAASPRNRGRSIRGYIQLLRIALITFGLIAILAILADRSPLTLLAGLGAVSAVLLLIFKDTILSVVASIQLASNDMLRVGDWIALPGDDVDGDVMEIALHTVKVRNWDQTISTVPTWHLVARPYRNYRSMYATGRRIRRALHIDLTSVRFLAPREVDHLRGLRLLRDYFTGKDAELAAWNADLEARGWSELNHRRLTNLGTFRAYMQACVNEHPGLNAKLIRVVRQLDPTPTGIPLEVYAFTLETGFLAHNNVQGDLFDHFIAILPEFGLRLFQQPAGADLRGLGGAAGAAAEGPA